MSYFIKNRKTHFFIIVFVITIPFIQAFSVPIPGTFAVQLDNDSTIDSAICTLEDNIPNLNIIEYNSLDYFLMVHRIMQPLIWIGHGNSDGIQINNKLHAWKDFAKEVSTTPAIDIILSCYSNEIIEQTALTQEDVVTFNGEIDSKLGSYITAWFLTGSIEILPKAITHYKELLLGEVQIDPLNYFDSGGTSGSGTGILDINLPDSYLDLDAFNSYVFSKMSGVELGYWIIMFFVLIIQLFLVVVIPHAQFTFLEAAAAEFFTVGMITLIIISHYYNAGQMTLAEAIENIGGVIHEALDCLISAINNAPASEIALFLVYVGLAALILLLEIIGNAVSGGAATILRIAVSATLIAVFLVGFLEDMLDVNMVIG